MVLASYHVIKDILDIMDKGDPRELQVICDKFCERYPQDLELGRIICEPDSKLSEYIISGDGRLLEDLRSDLIKLMDLRKMETSGGNKLWLSDRRH